MKHRTSIVASLAVGGLLLAACGSSGATPTTTSSTTTMTVGVTKNLVVTPAVRASIFGAEAKYHQLPTKDYVGLAPGMTYYAFDPMNDTYYAAAGLVPSSHSLPAQVGTQDDGGYNLLTHRNGHVTWRVYDDGLGAAQDSICPIKIPPSVLKVWNWRSGSCFPPIAS
jgi:predicted lipoprotein with Yx(FWY)xxD motif